MPLIYFAANGSEEIEGSHRLTGVFDIRSDKCEPLGANRWLFGPSRQPIICEGRSTARRLRQAASSSPLRCRIDNLIWLEPCRLEAVTLSSEVSHAVQGRIATGST